MQFLESQVLLAETKQKIAILEEENAENARELKLVNQQMLAWLMKEWKSIEDKTNHAVVAAIRHQLEACIRRELKK